MHSKILFHINIVAAGIFRLLLCKKVYTLYIGILFISNVCEAQSNQLDSSNVLDLKMDNIHSNALTFIQNHPIHHQGLKITEYYLDSIQIFDSTIIKEMHWDYYQKISRIESDSDFLANDSLPNYDLNYFLDYSIGSNGDQFFVEYARLSKWDKMKITLEDVALDFQKYATMPTTIGMKEELLVIHQNDFYIGQLYNRNSGFTYILKRK